MTPSPPNSPGPARDATIWLAAGAGALVAVALSVITRIVAPDTDDWAWVLGLGIPYGAGLGLLSRWWVLRFGVRHGGSSWFGRLAFRFALLGVMFALFEVFPVNVVIAIAPLVFTLMALTLTSVVGPPA